MGLELLIVLKPRAILRRSDEPTHGSLAVGFGVLTHEFNDVSSTCLSVHPAVFISMQEAKTLINNDLLKEFRRVHQSSKFDGTRHCFDDDSTAQFGKLGPNLKTFQGHHSHSSPNLYLGWCLAVISESLFSNARLANFGTRTLPTQ